MNRVLLINKSKAPSRAELTSVERRMGELLFAPKIHMLNWAGYIQAKGFNRLAVNWILKDQDCEEFLQWVQMLSNDNLDGDYEIAVYRSGENEFGGSCEIRVA